MIDLPNEKTPHRRQPGGVKKAFKVKVMIAARAFQVKPVIPFQFVALPVEILRRTDLSAAAKLLLAVVMDSARGNRSGTSKLTNAALAARVGRSAASIKRLLAELEAAGLVRRDTLAEGRVRTAVVPTWVDQERATDHASTAQDQPTPGAGMAEGVARDRPTIQSPPSEQIQKGTISRLTGEETEPKPSPAEIAKAMRAMLAGRYAPAMFDAESPPTDQPTPDPRALFRQVGYSAVAATRPRRLEHR